MYQRKDQKKRIYFETNENGNIYNIPKPRRAAIAVLEEKCIMINALIKTRRMQSQHTRFGSVSIHKELSERELKKKTNPYNGIKTIRYLGMNLALEVKNLYSENYKMVMKLKKTQRSRKISALFRLKNFNIVKMSTLP